MSLEVLINYGDWDIKLGIKVNSTTSRFSQPIAIHVDSFLIYQPLYRISFFCMNYKMRGCISLQMDYDVNQQYCVRNLPPT